MVLRDRSNILSGINRKLHNQVIFNFHHSTKIQSAWAAAPPGALTGFPGRRRCHHRRPAGVVTLPGPRPRGERTGRLDSASLEPSACGRGRAGSAGPGGPSAGEEARPSVRPSPWPPETHFPGKSVAISHKPFPREHAGSSLIFLWFSQRVSEPVNAQDSLPRWSGPSEERNASCQLCRALVVLSRRFRPPPEAGGRPGDPI